MGTATRKAYRMGNLGGAQRGKCFMTRPVDGDAPDSDQRSL